MTREDTAAASQTHRGRTQARERALSRGPFLVMRAGRRRSRRCPARLMRKQNGPPGGTPGDRKQAPAEEAPVVTSLTEAERDDLARKAGEANKRSEDNARARG